MMTEKNKIKQFQKFIENINTEKDDAHTTLTKALQFTEDTGHSNLQSNPPLFYKLLPHGIHFIWPTGITLTIKLHSLSTKPAYKIVAEFNHLAKATPE